MAYKYHCYAKYRNMLQTNKITSLWLIPCQIKFKILSLVKHFIAMRRCGEEISQNSVKLFI